MKKNLVSCHTNTQFNYVPRSGIAHPPPPSPEEVWEREGSKPVRFNLTELADFRLVMKEETGFEFYLSILTFNLLAQ